jgi:hypothetical protein
MAGDQVVFDAQLAEVLAMIALVDAQRFAMGSRPEPLRIASEKMNYLGAGDLEFDQGIRGKRHRWRE